MQPLQILITTSHFFSVSDQHLAQVQAAAPGSTIVVKPRKDLSLEDVQAADVIWGFPHPQWVAEAPRLRWLQLATAGSDSYFGVRPDLPITKSSGVFGIPIAEWVVATMLMLTRNLHLYRDLQREARWEERSGAREVFGSTVGILGLGDIGREVARRVQALGCRVIGARRSAAGTVPEYLDAVMSVDEVIPQADFLVMALPGTPETNGLMDGQRLGRMKPGSYLINVGRGSTVDEDALAEALRSGPLAGAALDVFVEEPLPATNPFWQLENVILSPHTSGRSSEANEERRAAIFVENLRRFMAGQPLQNVVNRQVGY